MPFADIKSSHDTPSRTTAKTRADPVKRPSLLDLLKVKITGANKSEPDSSEENSPTYPAFRPKSDDDVFKLRNASIRIFETMYTLGDVIGTGAFSQVFQITERRGERRTLACKVLDLSIEGEVPFEGQTTIEQAESELNVILTFKHPNLLELHDVFFDEVKSKCYMITSLSRGGTLKDAIDDRGSFTEDDAKTIMVGILRGISHMHSRGIAHRDLKPDNILIVDDYQATNVQLADFGMAKKLDPNSQHTVCGTPMYIAPEIIARLSSVVRAEDGAYSEYDTKADVWSCGVILYQILSGSPPFPGKAMGKLFAQIKKGDYDFRDPAWDFVSEKAKDLVEDMMKLDPMKRLTAEAALKHPWFQDS